MRVEVGPRFVFVGFIKDAIRFGYPDVEGDLVLAAFRLRFRPWAIGPLDAMDAGMIADLADRFGLKSA